MEVIIGKTIDSYIYICIYLVTSSEKTDSPTQPTLPVKSTDWGGLVALVELMQIPTKILTFCSSGWRAIYIYICTYTYTYWRINMTCKGTTSISGVPILNIQWRCYSFTNKTCICSPEHDLIRRSSISFIHHIHQWIDMHISNQFNHVHLFEL